MATKTSLARLIHQFLMANADDCGVNINWRSVIKSRAIANLAGLAVRGQDATVAARKYGETLVK